MAHILTVFGTGEGQTEKIADSITEEFRARGHEATTVNVAEIDSELDLDEFDGINPLFFYYARVTYTVNSPGP